MISSVNRFVTCGICCQIINHIPPHHVWHGSLQHVRVVGHDFYNDFVTKRDAVRGRARIIYPMGWTAIWQYIHVQCTGLLDKLWRHGRLRLQPNSLHV